MKRIAWLDIAKYICIMAVMLEHLESTTDELGCFFSPFFVLCFFAAAGYTHRAAAEGVLCEKTADAFCAVADIQRV